MMTKKIRVLHIDDSKIDRGLVLEILESSDTDFEVIQGSSFEELERLLRTGGFDVVLTDFNILGFDGLDVIDMVRKFDRHVPIIVVTGTGSETVAIEALKRGAADYVVKSLKHIRRLPLTVLSAVDEARLQLEKTRIERELELHRAHLEDLVRERTAELAALSDEMRLILDTVRATIWYRDIKNTIVRVNKAAAEFLGRSVEEIEGEAAKEVFPGYAPKYHEADLEVLRSGEPKIDVEEVWINRAGEKRYMQTDRIPLFDAAGAVKGLLVFGIDISDRKAAEAAAAENAENLRTMVNAMAGREIRMAELKEVIKKLRSQLKAAGMTPVADDPLLGS